MNNGPDFGYAASLIFETLLLLATASPPAVAAAPPVEYPVGTVSVVETTQSITVLFPVGVGIVLKRSAGGSIAGIEEILVGQRSVLSASASPLPAPVLEAFSPDVVGSVSDWSAYLLERESLAGAWPERGSRLMQTIELGEAAYLGWRMAESGAVIIETSVASGSVAGTLEWWFEPASFDVGANRYVGLGWRVVVSGAEEAAWLRIFEPALPVAGDWAFAQTWGNWVESEVGQGANFEVANSYYFADAQPFYFSGGATGAVLSFFDAPVAAEVAMSEDDGRHNLNVRIPLGTGSSRSTPVKYWLLADVALANKWQAVDEWTAVYDATATVYRDLIALPENQLVPMLEMRFPDETYMAGYIANGAPVLEDSWFHRFTTTVLPAAAEMGFAAIRVVAWETDAEHDPSEYLPGSEAFGSGNAPWSLEVSAAMGGMEGLRELVDRAHALGIKVLLWTSPGHLANSSPLLVANPEWVTWRNGGVPEDADFGDIVGVSQASGYFDYALARYAEVKVATGIDGFLVDSHLTFGVFPDFAKPQPEPQLDFTLATQSAWRALGCSEIFIEGCGPLGLSTGGYPGNEDFAADTPAEIREEATRRIGRFLGREYGLYRYVVETALEPERYYRALASKGYIGPHYLDLLDDLSADDVARIQRANKEYLTVMERMQRRRLIADAEVWQGVEWASSDSADLVVFSFSSFEYAAAPGTVVEDLSDGSIRPAIGSFTTQPWHTYVIRAAASCPATPSPTCRSAAKGKSRLRIKKKAGGNRQLGWRWKGSGGGGVADFDDPLSGALDYHFCLYDESSAAQPLFEAVLPAGATCDKAECWKAAGAVAAPRGFDYKDRGARDGGITRIRLRAGRSGGARLGLRAKHLPVPSLPLGGDVTMQFHVGEPASGQCWQSIYTAPTRNSADEFKARGQ